MIRQNGYNPFGVPIFDVGISTDGATMWAIEQESERTGLSKETVIEMLLCGAAAQNLPLNVESKED